MEINSNYKSSTKIYMKDKSVKLKILIRSKYILNKIFSFLNEKRKLIMIKYDKLFNKFLGITIEQYKKISGRIKIDGINEYGKEYDLESMNLIFKGFYLNGKKNGKGKEYFDDILIFQGEYLNGKRNGMGFEFNEEGKILFEGEYFNGKRWNGIIYKNNYKFTIKEGKGKIKEYNDKGVLIFEGEYLNGERNGKEYCDNGELLIFEGEYLNEKRWNGEIKDYFKFQKNNYRFCRRILFSKSKEEMKKLDKIIYNKVKEYRNIIKFEGEYLNGERNGKGKEYDFDGKIIFEGEYIDGEIEELYEKEFEYLLLFEGKLLNGEKNGKGKEYDI